MSDARYNPDGLVLSGDYQNTMRAFVLPWLAARRTEVMLTGDGGRPLYCCRYDAGSAAAGTVLIVHGFTENADKFAELIHSLLRNGYGVVAYDQRGHGRSWRDPMLGDVSLTHVDDFTEYVRDMEIVVREVLAAMPKPHLLFAHSMGGAVSSLFMEAHPRAFARAALCAPMILANFHMPPAAAKLMCAAEKKLGRARKRIFASKPYSGPEDFDTSAATGRERFDWYDAVKAANPAFHNNGPTYGWTAEALRAHEMVLAPGAVEKIDIPVRLYTAEHDGSVMPGAQQTFASRLKYGERTLVKGARHEIYRSTDEVLFPWWHGILGFYRGDHLTQQ